MHHTSFLAATAYACSHSREELLPEGELKAVLSGARAPHAQWLPHFATLFAEVPHAYLAGAMQELDLSPEQVKRAFLALPAEWQRRDFQEFEKSLKVMARGCRSGQLWLGRPEDGLWVRLLHQALQLLEQAGIPSTSWTLGGGVGVSLAFGHRESSEVDIHLRDPRLLDVLARQVRPENGLEVVVQKQYTRFLADHHEKYPSEQHWEQPCLCLSWYDRSINFVVAEPLTDFAPRPHTLAGETFFVDDPVEILAKKIVLRAVDFRDADLFDLASVWSCQPERVLPWARFFAPHLVPLDNRIRRLCQSMWLKLDRLDMRQAGMRLRNRELETFRDFFQAMVGRITNSQQGTFPYRWWCLWQRTKTAVWTELRQDAQAAVRLFQTFTRW